MSGGVRTPPDPPLATPLGVMEAVVVIAVAVVMEEAGMMAAVMVMAEAGAMAAVMVIAAAVVAAAGSLPEGTVGNARG